MATGHSESGGAGNSLRATVEESIADQVRKEMIYSTRNASSNILATFLKYSLCSCLLKCVHVF